MYTSKIKAAPPLVRLGHPLAFTTFLRRAGAPVDRYLHHAKLPLLCEDPDSFVPLMRAWSFFYTAAHHEDPMLGWLVGADIGDNNLNVGLLRKLENSPTLFRALQRLVAMAGAEASHVEVGIHQRETDVLFYTRYSGMRDVPGYPISQAYQLGVFLDLVRYFLGSDWLPQEIGVEHPFDTTVLEKYFPGCRILTKQHVGYITIARNSLHSAPLRADVNSRVADGPVQKNLDYLDTLRALLRSYLPDGYPSARLAAELMGVSERTLARRLSAAGLTYGTLVDEVRFEVAKKLLMKQGSRIGDVAASVGFDDQANFTRMFRRVGGLSPREFRKATLY